MQRIAHHNAHHAESPRQPRQRAQILPLVVTPLQGQHGLRSEPQLIRDSDANAAIADIETEIARLRFQNSAPSNDPNSPGGSWPWKEMPNPSDSSPIQSNLRNLHDVFSRL
jgi:hypothetical protein